MYFTKFRSLEGKKIKYLAQYISNLHYQYSINKLLKAKIIRDRSKNCSLAVFYINHTKKVLIQSKVDYTRISLNCRIEMNLTIDNLIYALSLQQIFLFRK